MSSWFKGLAKRKTTAVKSSGQAAEAPATHTPQHKTTALKAGDSPSDSVRLVFEKAVNEAEKLASSIKTKAQEEADKSAVGIKSKAQEEAERIISAAKHQAEELSRRARTQIQNAEELARQARMQSQKQKMLNNLLRAPGSRKKHPRHNL